MKSKAAYIGFNWMINYAVNDTLKGMRWIRQKQLASMSDNSITLKKTRLKFLSYVHFLTMTI